MNLYSLHILKNCTRATPFYERHKNTIQRQDSFTPQGFRTLSYGTVLNGGDWLTFRVPDPGAVSAWPAKKNDAVRLWHGLTCAVQTSVDNVQPDSAARELEYLCIGHAAHYGAKQAIASENPGYTRYIRDWVREVFIGFTLDGWTKAAKSCPWINSSEQFIDQTLLYQIYREYWPAVASSEILSEMAEYADYRVGMVPGPDSPDFLGCYGLWQPREKTTVDWILLPGDYNPIDLAGIKQDSSQYCNRVEYSYTDSVGATQANFVKDDASREEFTPGHWETITRNLSGNGYLNSTNAANIAQAQLNINKVPHVTGTIDIPLKYITHEQKGLQWAGLIRSGEVIRIPELGGSEYNPSKPVDNVSGFLVYSTEVKTADGVISIGFGSDTKKVESMIAQKSVQAA